jgi:hypothetical protein
MGRVSTSGKIKSRADLILELSHEIRYVAIIDYSNKVAECKGQGTFSLPLSLETMMDFVSIGPLLVMGALCHKLEPSCGRIGFVVGRFQKALLAIYQLRCDVVVILMDSLVEMGQLDEIASFLKKMEDSLTTTERLYPKFIEQ